jgi:hypothetical protein
VEDQVEGCSAGANGDRIFGLMQVGEGLLELPHPISHRHPAAIDCSGQGCLLIRAKDWL